MSDIPATWVLPRLAEIATTMSGVGFPIKYQGQSEGEFGFFKVGDISLAVIQHGGLIKTSNAQHRVSAEVAATLKGKPIAEGATIFAKIGEAIKLGRRAFVVDKCLVDNNVMAVKAILDESDRYLYRFMQTQDMTDLSRSTTVPSLRKSDIENLLVPLPPLKEQKRIADKLDAVLARVDACRQRLDRVPAILKRFRQSVLASAISGNLTVEWRRRNGVSSSEEIQQSKVSEPYPHVVTAPKCWTKFTLGELCEIIGGSQPPKSTFSTEPGPELIRLIQIRDYKSDKHLTYIPKELAKRFCSATDIMIGRYGPPLFQILRGLEGAYNVALMKAQPKTGDLSSEYLYVFLRSNALLKYVEGGSDRTAGQDGVRKELLNPYPFFLPSLEEQNEISSRVADLLQFADRFESKLSLTTDHVSRLTPATLAKAFRGELAPQDPNDEPANELLRKIQELRTAAPQKAKRGKTATGSTGRKRVARSPAKKSR